MLVFDRLKSQMELPEEEQLVVDSVRQMCRDRISPRAEIYDQSGAFPWNNVKEINELGLNAMFVPDEFGGGAVEMRYTTKTPQGATKKPRAKDGAASWREGMAGGKIDIKKAKVLNNLQKLLDKLGVEIYVYENFDAAQAYKEGNWGGLYKDGAVHMDQVCAPS